MRILQHRVNSLRTKNVHGIYGAELDVQVCEDGVPRVFHNPDSPRTPIQHIIDLLGFNHFFVDIKQNLEPEYLAQICDMFGPKLIGLFDVPYPSIYYANKAGLPVWQRISEHEDVNWSMPMRFWVDPLTSWTPFNYSRLIEKLPHMCDIMICSPELHGRNEHETAAVWAWLRQKRIDGVFGIVTKMPFAAQKLLGDI